MWCVHLREIRKQIVQTLDAFLGSEKVKPVKKRESSETGPEGSPVFISTRS
jgi:hypothetical protein